LAITRAEVGAAFIITPHCASPATDSGSPRGKRFSPQHHATPFYSKNIPFPQVIDTADPPIRPERNVQNSITSIHIAISRTLPRCPCCQRTYRHYQPKTVNRLESSDFLQITRFGFLRMHAPLLSLADNGGTYDRRTFYTVRLDTISADHSADIGSRLITSSISAFGRHQEAPRQWKSVFCK
jgi:hypothetical protein